MKVSTVVPAFNAELTIARALESVLAQNYPDQEILVVNDGSTDETAAILEGFRSQVRIIEQANRGAAAARNTGIANANGKYVAFLDSDDLWLPGKLAAMVAALERNANASVAFSEYTISSKPGVNYEDSTLSHAPAMQELMEELPPILTSTWVVRKDALARTGGFCESFSGQGYEDSWTLLLLRELGEFVYVPQTLTIYTVRETNENADKYAAGLRVFTALAKARYGTRSRHMVRNARNMQCRFLLTKLAHQMDRGERRAALSTLARIARLRPSYFLGRVFLRRLRMPHNTQRLLQLIVGGGE